jgi:hypothetical protein
VIKITRECARGNLSGGTISTPPVQTMMEALVSGSGNWSVSSLEVRWCEL